MTFKELDFYPNFFTDGEQAKYSFPNRYGISVVNGSRAECTEDTYEVGILHNGHLTYNTPLANDVLYCQTPEEINKLLATIEKWSPNQY